MHFSALKTFEYRGEGTVERTERLPQLRDAVRARIRQKGVEEGDNLQWPGAGSVFVARDGEEEFTEEKEETSLQLPPVWMDFYQN